MSGLVVTRFFGYLFGFFTWGCPVGWLAGWLGSMGLFYGGLCGWLVGWLAGWFERLTGWLVGWLADLLACWLVGCACIHHTWDNNSDTT